jgi:nitrite reductase (NO-forming)
MRENLVPIVVATLLVGGLLYVASPHDNAASPDAGQSTVATVAAPPAPEQKLASAGNPSTPGQRQVTPPSASSSAQSRAAAAAPPSASADHGHGAAATASAPKAVAQAPAPTAQPSAGSAATMAGDPQAGKLVYRKCQACHSMEPGKNSVGPSLAGIVGKKSASDPAYNYSPAMRNANLTWDTRTLDAYLVDPQKAMPGNKMPFPGLKTENERQNLVAFLAASSSPGGAIVAQRTPAPTAQTPPPASGPTQAPAAATSAYVGDARFTLRSGIAEGRMVYLGVGGSIDGKVNPVLSAVEGQMVQIILINGEGAEHDIVFPDQDARSQRITGRGASTTMAFRAGRSGDFTYYCDVPGHRLAGMEGKFLVTPVPPAQTVVEANISYDPSDLPPPITRREPQTVRVDLFTVELEGRLAEGTTFGYWTFNGKVPGPFLRVRVGDTLEVRLKNSADSTLIHSVDFHAATGPGGGAAATQTDPGQEKVVKFKALVPGLYVYHCATPMVAHHIANGMYGLILVEPEDGLPPVDREFYVMQGEIYTEGAFGQHGSQEFSVDKLLNERPEYFVFNGSVGALSKLNPLKAKVGETVRIFFGVGGPNYTSSFHVIGEIFDRVYNLGGVLNEPLRGLQTVTVPAGGAVITDFKVEYPGNYILVDHALSRAERGLLGILQVEGPANPEIYEGKVEMGSH